MTTRPHAFPAYRSFRVETGLYIIEPKGGRTYQARARVDGVWHYTGTETADYRAAEQFARQWFRGLRSGQEGHETITQAAIAFLAATRDADKCAYHTMKWNAVREFWSTGFGTAPLVTAVDTPKIMEFIQWRQRRPTRRDTDPPISANTIHKDLVTLRQILKFAVIRGVIKTVPSFPGVQVVGSIKNNPQPWLTKEEWKHLTLTAAARIQQATNDRTRAQRQELWDFCEFMWFTGLRVNEARGLQVRDVTVAYTPLESPQRPQVATKASKPTRKPRVYVESVQTPYLQIRVRDSKTGPRVCHSRLGAYAVLTRLVKDKAKTDPLFREHHRDSFRELLIAAGLRTNAYGLPRNAKCLRPTAISHWLLDRPTIPLSWLATNCGTSITMLQQFYVKRLGLALDGSAWL